MNENTFTKPKCSRWGITTAGSNTEITKDAQKRVEKTGSHNPCHPFPKLRQPSSERHTPCEGRRMKWLPHFTMDPISRPTQLQASPYSLFSVPPQWPPAPSSQTQDQGPPTQTHMSGPPLQIQAAGPPGRPKHPSFPSGPRHQACPPADTGIRPVCPRTSAASLSMDTTRQPTQNFQTGWVVEGFPSLCFPETGLFLLC